MERIESDKGLVRRGGGVLLGVTFSFVVGCGGASSSASVGSSTTPSDNASSEHGTIAGTTALPSTAPAPLAHVFVVRDGQAQVLDPTTAASTAQLATSAPAGPTFYDASGGRVLMAATDRLVAFDIAGRTERTFAALPQTPCGALRPVAIGPAREHPESLCIVMTDGEGDAQTKQVEYRVTLATGAVTAAVSLDVSSACTGARIHDGPLCEPDLGQPSETIAVPDGFSLDGCTMRHGEAALPAIDGVTTGDCAVHSTDATRRYALVTRPVGLDDASAMTLHVFDFTNAAWIAGGSDQRVPMWSRITWGHAPNAVLVGPTLITWDAARHETALNDSAVWVP